MQRINASTYIIFNISFVRERDIMRKKSNGLFDAQNMLDIWKCQRIQPDH